MGDAVVFGAAKGVDQAAAEIIDQIPKTEGNFNFILGMYGLRVLALGTKLAINYNACNPFMDDSESKASTRP